MGGIVDPVQYGAAQCDDPIDVGAHAQAAGVRGGGDCRNLLVGELHPMNIGAAADGELDQVRPAVR